METSVGLTVNPKISVDCSLVHGHGPFASDAPASSRNLLVLGEVQDV